MTVKNVLDLFSGVALFLFGMTLMGDSLKKVAGSSLELILYKLAGSPLKGILLGTGVTAVIQSSSATSVMVVGFVNSGMMKIKQAIGVIMGAIIGTSITGWIISLSSIESSGSSVLSLISTDTLTAIIAIIGIGLRMFSKHTKQKHIGEIMLGFAVLMFGMKMMSSSVSGLRDSALFISLLLNFSNPIIGILFGAGFTAIIQSASAACGILQALSVTGAISFEIALPILMGIAIGASLPVIISSIGANVEAKRSAWSYLIIDVLGCLVVGVLYYGLSLFIDFGISGLILDTFSIALVNTILRIIMIVLLVPFIGLIQKIAEKIIKSDEEEDERYEEDKLEERFLDHPTIAIEQTRIVLNQMSEIVRNNIFRACEILRDFDEKKYKKVYNKEEVVDKYCDKIGTYLVKITRRELDRQQNTDVSKYLQVIGDLERISDHAINIADGAKKMVEEKIKFSKTADEEIKTLVIAIQDMAVITMEALLNNDDNLAIKIGPFEQLIDDIVDKMKDNHIERIRQGKCTLEQGIVFNDLLTDFERIADHLENIAVEIVETNDNSLERHKYKNEIIEARKEQFNMLLSQYKEKYKI